MNPEEEQSTDDAGDSSNWKPIAGWVPDEVTD